MKIRKPAPLRNRVGRWRGAAGLCYARGMTTTPRCLSRPTLLLAGLLLAGLGACSKNTVTAGGGTPLPEATRGLLERYEKVRAALAADDFGTAKFQAGQLAADAAKPGVPAPAKELAALAGAVAASPRLEPAREAFKDLSGAAIKLAAGAGGFYVVNCPMTKNGDWLQTNDKVSNPYYGRSMPDCGVVKR